MSYTLGEAAIACGKSKSTLSKAIKNGKISAKKNENGAFEIEPSELHRLYPPAPLAIEENTVKVLISNKRKHLIQHLKTLVILRC